MKPRLNVQTLFYSSLIDKALDPILLSPRRCLIGRNLARLIVNYPQLSIEPIDEVDHSFHDLPVTPWHDERDLTAKDLG